MTIGRNLASSAVFGALRLGIRPLGRRTVEWYARQAQLRHLLAQHEVNCVLDVGANLGRFSWTLRRMGYRGNLISFEPLPENHEKIAALAAGDPLWEVVGIALGAVRETRDFNIVRGSRENTELSSFFVPSVFPDEWEARLESTISVNVDRLDSVIGGLLASIREPRIFLKVDTQGYDIEVERGAAGILDKVVLLQSEVSVNPVYAGMPHYTEALAYYESLGFALIDLSVVSRTPKAAVREYDALMSK